MELFRIDVDPEVWIELVNLCVREDICLLVGVARYPLNCGLDWHPLQSSKPFPHE